MRSKDLRDDPCCHGNQNLCVVVVLVVVGC